MAPKSMPRLVSGPGSLVLSRYLDTFSRGMMLASELPSWHAQGSCTFTLTHICLLVLS
jgi:hypothetical protein